MSFVHTNNTKHKVEHNSIRVTSGNQNIIKNGSGHDTLYQFGRVYKLYVSDGVILGELLIVVIDEVVCLL